MHKNDFILKEVKTQENRLRYIEAVLTGVTPPDMLPRRVFIEPTNICNMRCVHCPTHTHMERPRGFMDFDLYKKIVDELAPYWAEITLNLYRHGEPTLHPRIFDMIDYAQGRNFFVQLNTNFANINSDTIKDILRLNYLGVSIDAASAETYRRVKGRDRFEGVLEAFLDYLEAWGETADPTSYACDVIFLGQKANEKEAPLFEEMFSRLPIGHVNVYGLHNFTGPITEGEGERPAGQAPESPNPRCNMPWDVMGINWDGEAVSCVMDFNNTYVLGNVATEGVLPLWNGERMSRFRQAIFQRDRACLGRAGELCANCSIPRNEDYDLPDDFCKEIGRMEKYFSAAVRRISEQRERHEKLMAKWTYLREHRADWLRELRQRGRELAAKA